MSASEPDLRAALRDGEGDAPDPDSMVLAGRARASARRTRIVAVSGAVAGVVVLGSVAGILLSHGGSGGSGATSAIGSRASDRAGATAGAGEPRSGTGPVSGPATTGAAGGAARAVAQCPSSFPTEMVPGGGGTGQFGATGALFAQPVASVIVCAYGSTGSTGAPGAQTLTGSAAQQLVASLEGAATTRPVGMCEDYRVADDHRYAFIGITAAGTALPAVTTTLGQPSCTVRVTNGTSTRFAWSPPAGLSATLNSVTPR